MHRFALPISLLFLIATASALAKDNPDAKAQAALDNARAISNLHQSGTVPYRLQASFETYDYKGVPDGQGTITETYLREGLWQRETLYRDKHATVTFAEGKLHADYGAGYQSTFPLGHVVGDVFAPIPSRDEMKNYIFKSTTAKTGGISLNCVVGSLPYLPGARPGSMEAQYTAPNQAYCMENKDPAILRIIQGHHGLTFAFNRIFKFGSVYVPGDITMMEKGQMRAHLHVETLMSVPSLSEKDIVVPSADSGGAQKIPATIIKGHVIHHVDPYYPQDAKNRRIQGAVILHAIIGKDGHIRELELVSAPDDSLVDSAMESVRQWVYSPYLLNGAPAEVDTTITVNYRIGS